MKNICTLTDKEILGLDGLSSKAPRITARAIVKRTDGLYAVMYAEKFNIYTLPGGGVEDGEDILEALRRELDEEIGCVCESIEELGFVAENRGQLDYTQRSHYYVVTTSGSRHNVHLTEDEAANGTTLQWHTLDEVYALISSPVFNRIQGKYLQARDIAALNEYLKLQH